MTIYDPYAKDNIQTASGSSHLNPASDGQERHAPMQQAEPSPQSQSIKAQRMAEAKKFKAAQLSSRRVRNLKIGLPIIGSIFIIIFVGFVVLAQYTALPLGFAAIDLTGGELVMESPTLNGFTSDDGEYEIVAERAVQDLADPKKVFLEQIGATLTLEDGNIISIDAGKGQFHVEIQDFKLTKGISLHTSTGYTGELKSAYIDIKGGSLVSNEEVFFKGDIGEISANHLTVRDNATFILFEDRVRMTINPNKIRQE